MRSANINETGARMIFKVMNSPSNPGTSGGCTVHFRAHLLLWEYSGWQVSLPFWSSSCIPHWVTRRHELIGLHYLTQSIIAVIYCNNFQYDQGAKGNIFCHGSHGYSQTEVPAFKFMSPTKSS